MLNPRFLPGAPIWVDLGVPDIEAAAAFYRELFGWEFQSGGPEVGGYGTFLLKGRAAAGGMAVTAEQGPAAWSVYFGTPDADDTAKSVEQAGGRATYGPMDVMDLGRMAGFTDAQEVPFSVWQPGRNKGLEVVREPGSLCWCELYTPDVPAAAAFYGAVFGWRTFDVSFEHGSYTTVHPADGTEEDMFGGMARLADDPAEADSGAYWLPYFEVADCEAAVARARGLGAEVRMEPVSMEGVGDFARLADPQGARFAVLKSVPPGGS